METISVKKLLFAIWMVCLVPLSAAADIIYFKDGMKTICHERAWEENGEVKCEYDGAILNYQKKDVDRILKVEKKKEIESPAPRKEKPPKPASKPIIQTRKIKPPDTKHNADREKKTQSVGKKKSQPNNRGLEFYNPRRPQKYWSDAASKHNTFKEAISALAMQYDRSPEWIQHHMGETNDLGEIHRNLQHSQTNAPAEIQTEESAEPPEILFYNPRRPQKYWTSKTAKHHTYKEAISALAKEYQRSQEWIQQHMGNTNNLNQIRQNLEDSQSAGPTP